MKKLLLVCLVLAQSIGFSQNQFRYNHVTFGLYSKYINSQKKSLKKNNINSVKRFKIDKNNKKILVNEDVLDTSFHLVYKTSNMDEKRMYQSSFSKFPHKTIYRRSYGKNVYQNVYDYVYLDSNKKFIAEIKHYSKNKLYSTNKIYRQSDGKIDSVYFYSKRKKTPTSKLAYSYKNGKVSETKYYRKGKLKRIQKFDCNPIGESIKKVKQTKVCKNTEYDKEGNKINIKVTTDEKGREKKTKTTFYKDSDTLIKMENFNYKNKLTYFWEKKNGVVTNINYWGRNGKNTYKTVTTYTSTDYEKMKSEVTHYKGKFQYSIEYFYNSKGLIEKEIKTNRKGKKTTFLYEYKTNL